MSENNPPEDPKDPQESKSPEERSVSDSESKDSDPRGILGIFLGIAALLAAVIALGFRSFILWTVLMVAFTIAGLPFFPTLRKRKYITHAYALLCAILVFAIYHDHASRGAAPVTAKPVLTPSITRSSIEIDQPLPNSPVAHCVNISGKAKIPVGDVIWILVQGQNPTVYYPEGKANISQSQVDPGYVGWTYDSARIGSPGSSAKYYIYAVAVNSETSDFMAGLETTSLTMTKSITLAPFEADIDIQADPNLPPGVVAQKSEMVQRLATAEGDCG